MTNKKGDIIGAAIHRIAMQGDSFSAAQIAADVGCSQSLLFRYYGTKDGLMSACFDTVCHELMGVLRGVEVPGRPDIEKVNRYIIRVWEAYCGYLGSNSHMARAYLFFVGRGMRFPKGYRNAGGVLRRMLGDDYHSIVSIYPDFGFIAEYMIMFSYAAATGLFVVHDMDSDDILNKVERILKHGICGYGRDR